MDDKKLIDFAKWLTPALRAGACVAAALLAALLTSCSPLATSEAVPTTATAAPSVTASKSANLQVSTPTPEKSTRVDFCTVTAGALNFREGPGMSYAVKQILRKGDRLEVIERGAWLHVSTGTATGFIYSAYCGEE